VYEVKMSQLTTQLNQEAFDINEKIYSRLDEVCSPFLINFPLKRFVYSKFFLDENWKSDKVMMVSTDLASLRYYLLEIKNHGNDFIKAIRCIEEGGEGLFLWPSHTNDGLLNMYKKNFNLRNGVTIYKRHKKYIESWCFAGNPDSSFITVLKPEDQKIFREWASYFRDKFPTILTIKEPIKYFSSKIDMSPLPNFINREELLKTMKSSQQTLCGRNGFFTLSERQFECLVLLSEGKTIKGIAGCLSISDRTVEDYLNEVKRKSDFRYQNQLIEMFREYLENRNHL
jgi:DNA-binding CsgD family transcriptional regulator